MSDIVIAGNTYAGVPSITVPKVGGGFATFSEGGGTSPWTLIKEQEFSVSTTSSSAATAATIACGSAISTKDKIVWVHIRDTAGARDGYFFGSDAFFINCRKANGSTNTFAAPALLCIRYTTTYGFDGTAGQYGIYAYSISSTGSLIIRRRYNSTYSLTINGTFKASIYTLDLPSGLTLFG